MSPLLALFAFQDAAFDPLKDPALEKPITVHLALSPLRTVVAAMAKESGQPLDVSGAAFDLKATVLVKGLSTGRTMEALADTLGLVWKKDAGAYRLTRPEGSAAAEAAYLKAERADRQGSNTAMIGGPAVVPGTVVRPTRRPRRGLGGMRQDDSNLTVAAEAAKVPYVRFDPNLLAVEGSESPPPPASNPPPPAATSPSPKPPPHGRACRRSSTPPGGTRPLRPAPAHRRGKASSTRSATC